jgi:hypothetical protein
MLAHGEGAMKGSLGQLQLVVGGVGLTPGLGCIRFSPGAWRSSTRSSCDRAVLWGGISLLEAGHTHQGLE